MRKTALAILGVVLFSFIAPTTGFSQGSSPNMHGWHAKYWFYRWRLRNDFMVMGEGPGQSLVAEKRNPNRDGYIKWSDGMIMHGYYLTMLAIEHKILQTKGRYADLKNNERELYYALKAFERVDNVSETFYSADGDKNDEESYRLGDNTLPPDVNGYFHRDDVPPTFINENQWGVWPPTPPNYTSNHQKLTSGRTGINYGGEINYSVSDCSSLWSTTNTSDGDSPPLLSEPQHPVVNYENGSVSVADGGPGHYGFGEESIDQVIRLLLGFFTIVKSIEDVSFGIDLDKDGIDDVWMNFQDEAKRHSTNIIGRFTGKFSGTLEIGPDSNEFWMYSTLLIPGGHAFWTIKNPRHNTVSLGGLIENYMPPIQKISKTLFTENNDLGISSQHYGSWPSSSVHNSVWGSGTIGYASVKNVKMSLLLNTISKSGSGPLPVGRFIYNKSFNHHYQAFYTPLFDYLWGWDPNGDNDQNKKAEAYQYANMMLEAAPCVGPHNFCETAENPENSNPIGAFSPHQDPDGIPYYWNVPFVFDNDHDEWDDGYSVEEGWFSGVDYMLLYNLIYANNDEEQPLYHDLINRVIDYDINTDLYSDLYGYSATGLMVGAFENLTVKSNIYGNTPVTLKALDYVQLDTGIYDPNNMPEGITIEVGKITCGNDFTSSNTPYSINQCATCNLEEQVGSLIMPTSSGRSLSSYMEMEELAERNELSLDREGAEDSKITIFPNPTSGYFAVSEQFQELILLDQNGSEVKRFDNRGQLFDISELSSGIYTLMIKLNDYETTHVKLVKL